jgi:hypothetical protein
VRVIPRTMDWGGRRPVPPACARHRPTRFSAGDRKRANLCNISASHIEAMVVAVFIDPARWGNAVELARGVARLSDRMARSE